MLLWAAWAAQSAQAHLGRDNNTYKSCSACLPAQHQSAYPSGMLANVKSPHHLVLPFHHCPDCAARQQPAAQCQHPHVTLGGDQPKYLHLVMLQASKFTYLSGSCPRHHTPSGLAPRYLCGLCRLCTTGGTVPVRANMLWTLD